MAVTIPGTHIPLIDERGRVNPSWYRWLAQFERDFDTSGDGAGAGLTREVDGDLAIADNGVTNAMLEESPACSVIGRDVNSSGNRDDILATANGHFLQRDGDTVLFRLPKLPSYTVATLPNAADFGAGTMVYCSDGRNEGEGAAAGTGSSVVSDGTNWKVPGTPGAVAA
jgi:hypothetical protein